MTPEEHYAHSQATLAVVKAMEVALGENANDMEKYFHRDFQWMGNFGCGTKDGLQAFRDNWQLPLRAAFTEREYKTQRFLADGDMASCFGHIEGTHSGTFMGVEATGKRVKIPYIDFWLVKDGLIMDNWVSVDFALVLSQLGEDVFVGRGWEAFDDGRLMPPKPV